MERKSGAELQVEAPDGGLKELVMKWFTETQAPLILHNGNFPDWFQGLAARKDAEDLLRDKALGCFLVRLSDKAIGYILSYKGHDRCRHFVITQNHDGQFVISGDCQTYGSLAELIEHYKVSPILPFGEYLISSCYEADAGDLYDVVNAEAKSGVSVQALRTLWDQKNDRHGDAGSNQSHPPAAQPPALPPKSKSRKLTGTVSVDVVSLSQGGPPVPKRGVPLGFSLSGSFPDTTSRPCDPQTDSQRVEKLTGNTNPAASCDRTTDTNHPSDLCPPGIPYSELTQVERRSQSLPRLHHNNMEDEEYSNQLSSPSCTPPSPLKRVTCHTYSLHTPREALRRSSSRSEWRSDNLDILRSNPLYQVSEGRVGISDGMHADDTYEQIPEEAAAVQGNTYESLKDVKTKKSKSTWGKNNMKWKKFLPDYKKK